MRSGSLQPSRLLTMKNRTSRQTPWLRMQRLGESLKRETRYKLFTDSVNKIGLSANDDKRIIRPDKIQTQAYGFRAWGALGKRGGQ